MVYRKPMAWVCTTSLLLGAAVVVTCGGTTSPSGPDAATDGATVSDVQGDGTTPVGDATSDAPATADAGDAGDGGAPADAAPGTYTAHGYSGGLDHLFIYKADAQRKLCFAIALAAPQANNSGMTLPAQWGSVNAFAYDDDKACVFGYAGDAGMALSSGQTGSIDWPDSGFQIPTTLTNIDVTLDFDAGPVWVPTSEVLSAANVPVQ